MIKLRPLEKKDAKFMIEWMHDEKTQKCFKKNMMSTSFEEAEKFCEGAKISDKPDDGDSLHWAIVDDNDEYLGTISLKDIDLDSKSAEYAIAIRPSVRGKGLGYEASKQILDYAFNRYGLELVYLNVWIENNSAIRLYEKCGFVCVGEAPEYTDLTGELQLQHRYELRL